MADVFPTDRSRTRREARKERRAWSERGPALSVQEGAWLAGAAFTGRAREELLSEEATKSDAAEGAGAKISPLSAAREDRRPRAPAGSHDAVDLLGNLASEAAGHGGVGFWGALRLILRAYGAAVILAVAGGIVLLLLLG
jgi:hypothetical protein